MASDELQLSTVEPDYGGRCVTEIIGALLTRRPNAVIDEEVLGARTVVLLVVDGLGWLQLQRFASCAPLLASAADDHITSVAPSTTAAGLSSITTGATPGEHGLVSYQLPTEVGLVNTLRWKLVGRATSKPDDGATGERQDSVSGGSGHSAEAVDLRQQLDPDAVQQVEPFGGMRPTVHSPARFESSGFTAAYLRGGRYRPYGRFSQLVAGIDTAVAEGEPLVYAYMATLDRAGHGWGFGTTYQRVLAGVDQLVAELLSRLPPDAVLLVTADHGMVECEVALQALHPAVRRATAAASGEARFVWLHAHRHPDGAAELAHLAQQHHSHHARVLTAAQVEQLGLLGPKLGDLARSRLGEVALLPDGPFGYTLPDVKGPNRDLVGRHGGLTAEEMLVPLAKLWGGRQ